MPFVIITYELLLARPEDTKIRLAFIFGAWLAHSLAKDPDLAKRVEKRLAEMRIEQDLIALREQRGLTQAHARQASRDQPASGREDGGAGWQPRDPDPGPRRGGPRGSPGDPPGRTPRPIDWTPGPALRHRRRCSRVRTGGGRRLWPQVCREEEVDPSRRPEEGTITKARKDGATHRTKEEARPQNGRSRQERVRPPGGSPRAILRRV